MRLAPPFPAYPGTWFLAFMCKAGKLSIAERQDQEGIFNSEIHGSGESWIAATIVFDWFADGGAVRGYFLALVR
jgi:hypothetical protein